MLVGIFSSCLFVKTNKQVVEVFRKISGCGAKKLVLKSPRYLTVALSVVPMLAE